MDNEFIGYLKYEGKLVEKGLLDARKAAQALLGFDEAIRFYVGQQSPLLRDLDFELPVRITEGSWIAFLPHDLVDWAVTVVGSGATAYMVTAAKKMADNDFADKGLRDVFVHAIEAVQWTIRIGKHMGEVTTKRFSSVRFRKENTEIGIPNRDDQFLYVPKNFLDLYASASPRLLKKLAELVDVERRLEIGVYKGDNNLDRESIVHEQRAIFTFSEDDEEILFPEFAHGQEVSLEGHITRGNENTNSLGFMYKGHILACYPATGSIVNYKGSLFANCLVQGSISRLDKFGGYNEKKPKIIFSRIEPLERTGTDIPLF